MIHGVIFDMDGLLFDTERVWDSLWPVCFEQLGLPLPPLRPFIPTGGACQARTPRPISAGTTPRPIPGRSS